MSEEPKDKLESGEPTEQELNTRRDFLKSLGRWSAIIIGAAALGGFTPPEEAAGWINGGGSWVNGRGGGGSWVNRGGSWVNRGGGWINGGGGGWINRRGSWVNRH
jgi:hypothetical protein